MLDVDTPQGLARVRVEAAVEPIAALVLGHGAGGSIDAPDLQAATEVALALHVTVARVEQPYRVAGKKATPRPPVLDSAWTAVVAALRAGPLGSLPLVVGGRSSGARVACRTAGPLGAVGVLCLAFPLQPAARAGREPPPSRQAELDLPDVPVLVVQGASDAFGVPSPDGRREVVVTRGTHALRTKAEVAAVRDAVAGWLPRTVP